MRRIGNDVVDESKRVQPLDLNIGQALELPVGLAAIHDDQLDAAAAAYAAYLWATKQASSTGAEVVPNES